MNNRAALLVAVTGSLAFSSWARPTNSMSATVLQFPKSLPRPQQVRARAPEYFCTKCDNDFFRINEDGHVHCGRCDMRMSNLFVHYIA